MLEDLWKHIIQDVVVNKGVCSFRYAPCILTHYSPLCPITCGDNLPGSRCYARLFYTAILVWSHPASFMTSNLALCPGIINCFLRCTLSRNTCIRRKQYWLSYPAMQTNFILFGVSCPVLPMSTTFVKVYLVSGCLITLTWNFLHWIRYWDSMPDIALRPCCAVCC